MLGNEPTPEANGYGVGSTTRLKLREQVPDDLAVDEAVGDELQDLDLACGRILSDLTLDLRRKGNDRPVAARAATRCGRLETAAVIAIPVEDLLTLCGVHDWGIGDPLAAL